ncbi:MAG: hypothetical protein HY517_03620 [Candidatus Aenigmarchaeota archaeon]|nr:hypothetical protein [Candidatus Aenigmarchaeota archaeon]
MHEVNFLIRRLKPDGTQYGWALVNRDGNFESYAYGPDLSGLAAECRREGMFFKKGDALTTIGQKTTIEMGEYRDAPAAAEDMDAFFAELKKSGVYREQAA